MRYSRMIPAAAALLTIVSVSQAPAQVPATRRPMTFLDMQLTNQASAPVPSPDGKWALYTISFPDWKEARRQSDIHLVSMDQGVSSTRRLTFTKEKNETGPRWSRDGSFFAFLSNRDAPNNGTQNQIYFMRVDGGEAWKVTDAARGRHRLQFHARWQVGPLSNRPRGRAAALSAADRRHRRSRSRNSSLSSPTGVGDWGSRAGRQAHLLRHRRHDRRGRAARAGEALHGQHPQRGDAARQPVGARPRRQQATRLTRDTTITVTNFTISEDSRWVGFRGTSANRYERNITEQSIYADLFLLDGVERADRAAHQQRGSRRERPQLLAGQQVDRVLGARRPRRSTP